MHQGGDNGSSVYEQALEFKKPIRHMKILGQAWKQQVKLLLDTYKKYLNEAQELSSNANRNPMNLVPTHSLVLPRNSRRLELLQKCKTLVHPEKRCVNILNKYATTTNQFQLWYVGKLIQMKQLDVEVNLLFGSNRQIKPLQESSWPSFIKSSWLSSMENLGAENSTIEFEKPDIPGFKDLIFNSLMFYTNKEEPLLNELQIRVNKMKDLIVEIQLSELLDEAALAGEKSNEESVSTEQSSVDTEIQQEQKEKSCFNDKSITSEGEMIQQTPKIIPKKAEVSSQIGVDSPGNGNLYKDEAQNCPKDHKPSLFIRILLATCMIIPSNFENDPKMLPVLPKNIDSFESLFNNNKHQQ